MQLKKHIQSNRIRIYSKYLNSHETISLNFPMNVLELLLRMVELIATEMNSVTNSVQCGFGYKARIFLALQWADLSAIILRLQLEWHGKLKSKSSTWISLHLHNKHLHRIHHEHQLQIDNSSNSSNNRRIKISIGLKLSEVSLLSVVMECGNSYQMRILCVK